MEQSSQPGETMTDRERSAGHVLDAYRERRRRRRADDTYFGSSLSPEQGSDCLLSRTEEGVEERDLVQRRIELLEEAEQNGMSRELAELLYDVAREEGLDPGLGYELVRSGLGVCPPTDGMSNAPSQATSDKYVPDWLAPPVHTDSLLRERMLRLSFRRLRSLLERHEDLEEAFRAFAREPDVGHMGY
ncbi:MAG TPA: hypothetical protein VHG28_09575 [Longimicrobiaceae bacterium]|nr:hypothetical protein [Longimicrobiaceae bacterium]